MNIQHNLAVVDAAIEEFNARDWERFGEVHSETVILSAPTLPEPAIGRPAVREWASTLATTFPDLTWNLIRSFGQGDMVCAEIIATGTHLGPLNGPGGKTIPATNRPVELSLGVVFKVEGDVVSEVRIYNNLLSLLAQLGLAA